MGAASRKERPTPSQTLLASFALMRRSLRPSSLASPPPSFFPAHSPARSRAGLARGVRRAPAPAPARCQSVFHANPRAASFPSAVTAPLPPGLPASSPAPRRLLPRAPCRPPASGRAPGLPPPALSTPTWATGDRGGPDLNAQDPARPRPEGRRRREEVVGKKRREGPQAGGLGLGRASSLGTHALEAQSEWRARKVRFAANEHRPANGWRCTPASTRV